MSAVAIAANDDGVSAATAGFAMVYQPIVRLQDHRVIAHEALMRPDDGSSPLQLLDRARTEGVLGELETRAVRGAAAGYDFAGGGLLLLNLSAHAILGGSTRPQQVLEALQAGGRDLRNYVVEITERDIVEDCQQLAHAIGYLRAAGVRIALDDFGNGHSNFELWHELSPEFVKIDRFLVHGLADSAGRLNILKALVQVADGFGTELIAEGVERIEDLRVLRDLGIPLVQGYLLGRPSATISRTVSDAVRATADDKIQVWPRDDRPSAFRRILAEHMLIEAPSIRDSATNHDAEVLFRQNPQLTAIPVVDRDDLPVGLINRRAFNEQMAMPFARELLGRKPCTTHMNASPVLCDVRRSVDEMSQILLGEDQRYLYDGFIITDNGRYRGVGTGEALVRRVTELRIDAARYANPLTQLPGNIPITEHVRRLVETGQGFVACYCDLNHFKPYNDQYGYFLGDRMIQLVASTLLRHADPRWDFVGHVGGDDFVMLMQSDDWALRCERVVGEFNAAALALFDPEDRARGVLEGEDRSGRYATFPLTTLTIGIVQVAAGERSGAEDIASSAARAKREAKRRGLSVHVLERQA
ncbi:GGDEF domain-containing protein [Luteimonas fraxinea]|uniref:GGDEF domain-containing protein n=1 Tax=Luteimonas fraxinea TaxID=2901869 RepID=A0ABS8UDY2_9GAMM|nr:GGDEF domain-containing protein [Luteimonas fraxinea]MCD9097207.1 GGDEF domain-containing protein [Luteimonas fraxinea]MCD9125227.1 GGDEF domain-containing protein [Luteimonas fraxinea]UHH11473.1 GGDEF domain-containing protein [Luteimonas fraxinea]